MQYRIPRALPGAKCNHWAYSPPQHPFPSPEPGNTNLVNAALLPAQSVDWAFAIVKAGPRESLGIIKKQKIIRYKIPALFKEICTGKHFGKIIKGLLKTIKEIIFTVI